MDTDDEELKATKGLRKYKFFNCTGGYTLLYEDKIEMSLYEKEQQEKKILKELKLILHDKKCLPNWREIIEETIKLLEGY